MSGSPAMHPGLPSRVERDGLGTGRGEDYAAATLAALPEGVVTQLASGEIVFCNPAAERILGLTLDQMNGRAAVDPGWRAIHEDGSPFPGETHPAIAALRSGEPLRDAVLGLQPPGGSLRWVSISSRRVPGPDGTSGLVVTTFDDVTERRFAEEERRKSQDNLRFVFESSAAGMSMTSLSGEVRVNDAFARLLGYERREMEGSSWQRFTHPDDVEETRRQMAALLRGERNAARFTKRFLRKDGAVVWTDVSSSVRRDASGAPLVFITTVTDITERKRAEDSLRTSEERYREIIETTHEGVWLVNANSRTTFVNPRMAEMLGVEPEEMIGRSPLEFVFDEDRAEARRRIAQGMSGIDGQHDFRLRRKDGSEIWMHISSNTLRPRAGPPTGALAMFTDITARRRTEEALKESEARFRLLAENSTDIIGVVGQDGVVKYHSPAFRRVTGFEPEELLGHRVSEIYHPEDRPVVERAMARHSAGDELVRVRYRVRHKDGRLIWAEQISRAIRRPGTEEILEFQVAIRDITETKEIEDEVLRHRDHLEELVAERTATLQSSNSALRESEAALRTSESKFRQIVETAHEGIWQLDAEAKTSFVNRRMAEILGYEPEEMLGQTPLAFMAESERADAVRRIEGARQGNPESFERRLRSKAGSDVWVRFARSSLLSPEGAFVGVLAMVTDITKRREADEAILRLNATLEERVRERTAELEAVNRELEAFSFSVSHDLRAPLWAIAGFSRTIVEDYGPLLGDEGERRLEVVRSTVLRMVRLVDDLLAFSRIGRAPIRRGRMKMGNVVLAAFAEVLEDPAARKDVDFAVGDLPEVSGDPALVRQLWINLLSNAVKFSSRRERPEIRVVASIAEGEAVFSVRDNGVGFDMTEVDKLFGVFQRLHAETDFPGTGIGLSLVRRIVERHGGRVWAEGEVEKGAAFHFTLGPPPKGADATGGWRAASS